MSKGPRPIGELFPAVLERSARLIALHELINGTPVAADRKRLIMLARDVGIITDEQTEMLISVYQLETA